MNYQSKNTRKKYQCHWFRQLRDTFKKQKKMHKKACTIKSKKTKKADSYNDSHQRYYQSNSVE